jgi:MOSC domain-containing protein YiiM
VAVARALLETCFDSENGILLKRDLDIVATLDRAFSHINMGVYADVLAGGEIAGGDQLSASLTISTG